jgi:hypothetical protein
MQPGYGWPDHRPQQYGYKKNQNDLVKPIKKPEGKPDKDQDKSGPHNPPECPFIQW